jgi:3-dehydroquinate synthase
LDPSAVLDTLQGDKKVKNGRVRFVIPSRIGAVSVYSDVTTEQINTCLQALS